MPAPPPINALINGHYIAARFLRHFTEHSGKKSDEKNSKHEAVNGLWWRKSTTHGKTP
ncbi:hypothetical protein GJ744_004232 [Endocarpon pusillum]|uniref:Uncharacterized protein n=1 Tax=Endocarpon pusillum TaxID=364733 RepID=A0A8H7DXQ1_9EURO|nr:hypothetical protein GJ744_004232 [Endocarpon pusillum]